MSEIPHRPILFSAPMVRALLEGKKTQTRRVMKPQPVTSPFPGMMDWKDGTFSIDALDRNSCLIAHCPYGKVGDRLWVRETWNTYLASTEAEREQCNKAFQAFQSGELAMTEAADQLATSTGPIQVLYAADFGDWAFNPESDLGPWKPSIFMPRWASRITLEITEIRVQRLQEITKEDVIEEGLTEWEGYPIEGMCAGWYQPFATLWDSINAKKYPWESDPWVWVLTFKQVEGPSGETQNDLLKKQIRGEV